MSDGTTGVYDEKNNLTSDFENRPESASNK
jgi:hypothetical protein